MSGQKTTKQWLLQNAFVLAGVGLTIANLYLASKLSPIVSSIQVVTSKVEAVEVQVGRHESDNNDDIRSINDKMDRLVQGINTTNAKLNQIVGKLEVMDRR